MTRAEAVTLARTIDYAQPDAPEAVADLLMGAVLEMHLGFRRLEAVGPEAPKEKVMNEEKPLAGLWRRNPETPEGKYLVQRRDGTVPEWPSLVIGAKDPAAPAAIRAYADEAEKLGMNAEYISNMRDLAVEFERYRAEHGNGDPDRGRHRIDNPEIISKMRQGRNA